MEKIIIDSKDIDKLYSVVSSFEKERKSELNKFSILETLSVLATILFICIAIHSTYETITIWILFSVVCLIIASSLPFYYNKKFQNHIKQNARNIIIKSLENIVKLKIGKKTSISKTELEMSGLFSSFDEISLDDVFSGEYKNIKFEIIECQLMCILPTFSGIIVNFQPNKKIATHTVITSKQDIAVNNTDFGLLLRGLGYFIFGSITAIPLLHYCYEQKTVYGSDEVGMFCLSLPFLTFLIIGIVFILRGLVNVFTKKNTAFEDVEFEKQFNVKTDDQIEARYFVNPVFMEHLKNMQKIFKAKNIKCSYFNNTMTVAMPTNKDLFELGSLFKPVCSKENIIDFYQDLRTVFLLIDYFNKLS